MAGSWMSRQLAVVAIAAAFLSSAVAAATIPTCATMAPAQSQMNVSSAALTVDRHPFGIAYYTNDIAFVVISRSVGVLDTSQLQPVLKSTITLPPHVLTRLGFNEDDPDTDDYIFHGLVLSPDRKNLYAAGGYGALVIDVERAIAGHHSPIVGVLANDGRAGNYSAMISITPDSQYVFLTQEFGSAFTRRKGDLEVWKVKRFPSGLVLGSYKGYVTLGYATVASAFSADNTKLYVTSEVRGDTGSSTQLEGSISVLDVATLKTNPSAALLWTVAAGCHPVRIKLGPDGKHIWINAREANELLVFDADSLNSKDTADDALVAQIQVGTSPVSLAIVGDYVLTADSNRFGYSNATTGLSVVDTGSVQQGKLASFPQIPTGAFPREFGLSPDENTLLVSEFDSYAIRAVDVSFLKKQKTNGQQKMRYQGPRHYM